MFRADLRISRTSAQFVLAYGLAVILVLTSDAILPEKYFIDHWRLIGYVDADNLVVTNSDSATAWLYRLLWRGLRSREMVGLANVSVAFFIAWFIARGFPRRDDSLRVGWISTWCVLSAVFLGMYSKEIISLLVVGVFVVAWHLRRPALITGSLIMAALYASYVRAYWGLILVLAVGVWFVFSLSLPLTGKIAALVAGLLVVSTAFRELTGSYITDIRLLTNLHRLDSPDAITMIGNPLRNTSPLSDVLNALYAWFGLLIPFHLLRTAAFQHIVFALWQVANVVLIWRAYAGARPILRGDPLLRSDMMMALSVLLGFTFVHATFEPDFGSYARHQIALLPLIAALLLRVKETSSKKQPIGIS